MSAVAAFFARPFGFPLAPLRQRPCASRCVSMFHLLRFEGFHALGQREHEASVLLLRGEPFPAALKPAQYSSDHEYCRARTREHLPLMRMVCAVRVVNP